MWGIFSALPCSTHLLCKTGYVPTVSTPEHTCNCPTLVKREWPLGFWPGLDSGQAARHTYHTRTLRNLQVSGLRRIHMATILPPPSACTARQTPGQRSTPHVKSTPSQAAVLTHDKERAAHHAACATLSCPCAPPVPESLLACRPCAGRQEALPRRACPNACTLGSARNHHLPCPCPCTVPPLAWVNHAAPTHARSLGKIAGRRGDILATPLHCCCSMRHSAHAAAGKLGGCMSG